MKRTIYSMLSLLVFSGLNAQICPPNDSTMMGSGSVNDVFYSLKKGSSTGDGTVKVSPNTNWHLAFSVQPGQFPQNPANGVAIRVNSTLGENPQIGATGTRLVKLPGSNANQWWNADTTGIDGMNELVDSDSTWNLSAFTMGYPNSGPFNFMWGTYNQVTHDMTSNNNIYVLYNKTANWYKKVHIKSLKYDTLWTAIISNLDNSDSVTLVINKRDYKKRMFIYYNVLTDQLIDREPDIDQWDLVWTKYKAMVAVPGGKIPHSVTGVLHNRGVSVARNTGKKCNEVWLTNKTALNSEMISTIGYDWKTFTGTAYAITDTLVYFVNTKDTHTYKMTMKSFGGGKTRINFYEATSSIQTTEAVNIQLYPNPAGKFIQLNSDADILEVRIFDLQGKELIISKDSTIDVSALQTGVYFITVKTGLGSYKQTFIKE